VTVLQQSSNASYLHRTVPLYSNNTRHESVLPDLAKPAMMIMPSHPVLHVWRESSQGLGGRRDMAISNSRLFCVAVKSTVNDRSQGRGIDVSIAALIAVGAAPRRTISAIRRPKLVSRRVGKATSWMECLRTRVWQTGCVACVGLFIAARAGLAGGSENWTAQATEMRPRPVTERELRLTVWETTLPSSSLTTSRERRKHEHWSGAKEQSQPPIGASCVPRELDQTATENLRPRS